MKVKNVLPFLISVMILTGAIIVKANSSVTEVDETPQTTPVVRMKAAQPEEMRGVWVTYMALDVENEVNKEAAFDNKIDAIIKDMKAGGFNTMVIQVRPFCDAIYPSEFFPWSHIISGEQGKDPGFDPLQHIVDKCRENQLYIHAWVNPYRVSTGNTPSDLSEDNPIIKDKDLGVEINGKQYLDPTLKTTQKLIANGVRELAENYDIDGIQFDDYFYPEDCGTFDRDVYADYLKEGGDLTLEQFRMRNVSDMVKEAYQAAHEGNEAVQFGISPQGNLGNNAGLFADVRTWCAEEGYLDYICPQIYFSLDNPALTFEDALQDWLKLKKHDGLKLYIGLAGYKAGTDADDGTWSDNEDILQTEVGILRQKKTDGFMLYSSDSFHDEDNQQEIGNLCRYLTTSATQ